MYLSCVSLYMGFSLSTAAHVNQHQADFKT